MIPTRPACARAWTGWLIIGAVLGAGLWAKAYTGCVWEDFLITFRFSQNFLDGHGLVYQAGERTFGFTSPLNVLLPILFKWLLGGEGFSRGLDGFVVVSLLVWGGGIAHYAGAVASGPARTARLEAGLLVLFSVLQVKLLIFAISGQEAGLWAGFLLLAFGALVQPAVRWKPLGLAWAGLLWTRPDCPVTIAGMIVAGLLFEKKGRRLELLGTFGRAAILAALIYLPWLVGTTWYYGSPVPHTILAKIGVFSSGFGLRDRLSLDLTMSWYACATVFQTIYSEFLGWPIWVSLFGSVVGLFCGLVWILPSQDRVTRMASFLFLESVAYLGFVGAAGTIYPWYFVPCATLGAIVLARVLARALTAPAAPRHRLIAVLSLLPLLYGLFYETTGTLVEMKVRQEVIEQGTRVRIGLWLRAHVPAGQSVFLEPSGYIGYYSGARLLDYPGLVNDAVLQTRHRFQTDMSGCIAVLQPDWLVLRPFEYQNASRVVNLSSLYTIAAVFDSRNQLRRYPEIKGDGFLRIDAVFYVLRKTQPSHGVHGRPAVEPTSIGTGVI